MTRAPALLVALFGVALADRAGATDEAAAASPRASNVHLALRTGFGVPLGTYAEQRSLAGFRETDVNALGDDTYGAVPLWLDAGYRLTPELMLGAYFVYGLVLPKTAASGDPLGGGCPEGFDCFASGVRLGLQAQYRFLLGPAFQPWLGIGVGYEWVSSRLEGQAFGIPLDASTSYSGPDLLHLQGGVDFRLGRVFGLGPFLSVSAMEYTSCSLELSADSSTCELNDKGWHGWLVFGVRGSAEL